VGEDFRQAANLDQRHAAMLAGLNHGFVQILTDRALCSHSTWAGAMAIRS
jgi:hypothetical protein